MNVQVMLNKMNSGQLQVTVVQGGQSTGTGMAYRTTDEVRDVLRSLRLDDHAVEARLQILEQIESNELLKFPSDISPEILHANGFTAV
jgi:hypothetical protein